MKTHGLVGFFDILGYQNIINNNELEDVVVIISEIINKNPGVVKESLKNYFPEGYNDSFVQGIKIELISDSLLLLFPIEGLKELKLSDIIKGTISFLEYVSLLTEAMFDKGLPLRGAVGYGNYYIDQKIFAGKCIIDCYRIAEELNLSGVVMKNDIYNAIIDLSYMNKEGDEIIIDNKSADKIKKELTQYMLGRWFKYLVPTKSQEIECYIGKWYISDTTIDVRQEVYESFSCHKKNIDNKTQQKLLNTELSIRAMVVHEKNMKKNNSKQE